MVVVVSQRPGTGTTAGKTMTVAPVAGCMAVAVEILGRRIGAAALLLSAVVVPSRLQLVLHLFELVPLLLDLIIIIRKETRREETKIRPKNAGTDSIYVRHRFFR